MVLMLVEGGRAPMADERVVQLLFLCVEDSRSPRALRGRVLPKVAPLMEALVVMVCPVRCRSWRR